MILCLGPTPAAQRVMRFRQFNLDAVNRAAQTLDGIAGKAVNVAKVLQQLGARPLLAGFLGGEAGVRFRAELARRQMASEWVEVAAPTRQCITVLDETAGTVTELVEESRAVAGADYDRLYEAVRRRLPDCRALVIAGTLTPGAPPDFYAQCAALARTRGLLTVVDTQGQALLSTLPAQPTLIKPNRQELAAALGRPLEHEAAWRQAMLELHHRGAGAVLCTAGQAPALLLEGGQFWRITPPRVTAANPIGSGDAFTAGLIASLLRGETMAAACGWGAAAGAANALTLMPGELDPAEVQRLRAEVAVAPLAGAPV